MTSTRSTKTVWGPNHQEAQDDGLQEVFYGRRDPPEDRAFHLQALGESPVPGGVQKRKRDEVIALPLAPEADVVDLPGDSGQAATHGVVQESLEPVQVVPGEDDGVRESELQAESHRPSPTGVRWPGSVFGVRPSALIRYRVPSTRVPGTWYPYRIPIPEGRAGIPAGFPLMFRRTHTRGLHPGILGNHPLGC